MADLKMNTDAVLKTAESIRIINNQIRDGYSDVKQSIMQLDNSWDGNASTNAIRKFNEISNSFLDQRYGVMNNYVSFMLQQVETGYVQTEDTNKSLADAFK